MVLIFDWMKLKNNEIITYFWIMAGLFLPGASYLYFTNIELFLSLGTAQLLLLSAFYSIPIVITTGIILPQSEFKDKKNIFREKVSVGCAYSLLASYMTAFIISSLNFDSDSYIKFWYVISVFAAIFANISEKIPNWRKSKKTPRNP